MDTGFRDGTRRTLLVMVLFIALTTPALAAAPDATQIRWNGHTLEVTSIEVNPEYILNDAPETSDYYMICLKSTADPVPVRDISELLNLFTLTDVDTGDSYAVGAYLPYNIVHNTRSHVFTTAQEQTQFTLFFVVPAGTALESLTLGTSSNALSLADLDLAALLVE